MDNLDLDKKKPPDIAMEEDIVNNPVDNQSSRKVQTDTNQRIILETAYRFDDSGPFQVIIESENADLAGVSRMHPMSLGKLLHSQHPEVSEHISSINKVGRNKIRVELTNFMTANKLIRSSVLKERGFKTYIPVYLVKRKFIVRGVDTSLSEEDVKNFMKDFRGNPLDILEIKRMNRKVIDPNTNATKYVPTQSVTITIRGQCTPNYVTILHVKCEVKPYIQRVTQCNQCWRYGHYKDQCKGKVRCDKCGGEHTNNSCSVTEPCCMHCGMKHFASNRAICPQYQKEQAIKQLMGTSNVSYFDAKCMISGETYAKAVPALSDMSSFPPLSTDSVPSRPYNTGIRIGKKRDRVQEPNLAAQKMATGMKEALISEPVLKNRTGGRIPVNPYSSSQGTGSSTSMTESRDMEAVTDIIVSVIQKVKGMLSNNIDESLLREIVRERLKT